MLISTRGRYALRIMADLAERQSEGFVPLKDLARCQEISEKYLETHSSGFAFFSAFS